jgi:hypothetical protein
MTVHLARSIPLTHIYMTVHLARSIPLTHIYMTVHLARSIPLTHIYMTVHFPGFACTSIKSYGIKFMRITLVVKWYGHASVFLIGVKR